MLNNINQDGFFIPILGIIGVGLIGGSFALSLRKKNRVGKILGFDSSSESLYMAKELGIIDEISTPKVIASLTNIMLIATPVSAFDELFASIIPNINSNTIITDVGSTKLEIINKARSILGDKIAHFIPAHPIAGSEISGPSAANPDLFKNCNVIITPLAENSLSNINYVKAAWHICGARTLDISADQHDHVMAAVSHMPHLISSIYMSYLSDLEDIDNLLSLAGSGFRDFTRISAGSGEMWADILLSNRDAILCNLNSIQLNIYKFVSIIKNNDRDKLKYLLNKAANIRRNWRKE